MSIKDEYVVILRQRLKEDGIDDAPDYYDNSPTIKAEINLLSRNLQETIDFLNNDCSAEQLIWLSEVFEEISAKLQSCDFIDALNRCADKYPEECKVYSIKECIEYAIGQLDDDVYQQRFPLKND
jgi:hypothetical protein